MLQQAPVSDSLSITAEKCTCNFVIDVVQLGICINNPELGKTSKKRSNCTTKNPGVAIPEKYDQNSNKYKLRERMVINTAKSPCQT